MNEALLQFIWQYSLYNSTDLYTNSGEKLIIIHPGVRNTNSGPDFLEGKIKIGDTILVGNIELHVNSSDWLKHGHQLDLAYNNVVLHVVYNIDNNNVTEHIELFELKGNIPSHIHTQYAYLANSQQQLPCARLIPQVNDLVKSSWVSRLLAERWEQKLVDWNELLEKSAGDWRSLLYWRTAVNFGFKTNATPFLMLAQSIPLTVLAKHRENLLQIEALLFGQAGMLEDVFTEQYPITLKEEYSYLQKKYSLQPIPAHLWKFMRMRPANFPTVRIAQFAALVNKSLHLFSQIVEVSTVKEIVPLLSVTASEYWNTHYRFEEVQKRPIVKHLGISSIYNVIVNTIAPIRFLYASKQGESFEQEKALQLLDEIPFEQNSIIDIWETSGWKINDAGQSQALIQLYNAYCTKKRCLECAIGLNIIRSAK
ncbi:MAG: DUF2851 family protein [Bacteroidota bacterium]